MNPKLSIIIPCFNSDRTLEETLISAYNQDYENWEVLIVNDGSTDNTELIALKWAKKDSRFKYFIKQNEGLGKARNFGINKSVGDFILPLDSDNKIRRSFAKKAISILLESPNTGVVYGDANYFGERSGIWKIGEFNKYRMLHHNFIDACAIIKRSLFETLGFYDENLPYQGHEDWEFWLRVLKSPYNFSYLQEITFDYRVTHKSMIRSFSDEMLEENINYIRSKHSKLYMESFSELYFQYLHLQNEVTSKKNLSLKNRFKKNFHFLKVFQFKSRT